MIGFMDTTPKKTLTPAEIIRGNRSAHPDYLTMLDISELADVDRRTVTKWQQRKLIPGPVLRLTANNRPLYDRKAVTEWLVRTGRLIAAAE